MLKRLLKYLQKQTSFKGQTEDQETFFDETHQARSLPKDDHSSQSSDEMTPEENIPPNPPLNLVNYTQITGLKDPRDFEVREMVFRQLKESRKIAKYMVSTDSLVEEKIKKAMEKGEFDNLKGKGEPLIFDENPYEDPALRLPFKILKDAGFAPYWIELGKEIDADIKGSRMMFDKFLEGIIRKKERKGYLEWTPELDQRRDEILSSCAKKIEGANKKIELYNRIVPMYFIQRLKIDEDKELLLMRQKWNDIVVRPSIGRE